MNQILVTEKIYVTPELRRKKKMFKLQFFFCVFLVCLLFSYYIYAEYDRDRSEAVSSEILTGLSQNANKKEDTTIKKDNIIVVALDDNDESNAPQVIQDITSTESINVGGTDYAVEAKIRIPKLDIDYPVLTETSEELLKIAINKYWGGSPNSIGNYCVVGHNYKSGKMFGHLSQIVSGDIIEVEDMRGNTVRYAVYDKYVVEPDDTTCTSQLTNGRREVTLITCTNYGKQRLVVKAREVK